MCSDASREAALKNTGLRLRYSTQVFKTAVEGQKAGVGIEPDILVEWGPEDYMSGDDPVLTAAVEAAD
jgi:C-terminal processing protease CtpA/Prc